jgi:hypothetical protein
MNFGTIVTAAMLSGALVSFPAIAQNAQDGFSALQGVDARALSADEMQAISGKLNAYDMAANREELAAKLDAYPRLQALVLRRADFILTHAEEINAAFARLGILTACRSCTP